MAPHRPVLDKSLGRFATEVFRHLPRSDQRRWARVYLHGLLTVQGRKSLQNLSRSAPASSTARQSLQQFISSSNWDWVPLRHALARYVHKNAAIDAWTLAPVAIPKRGEQSVGVCRRFVAEEGRTLNCQSATGLFLATGAGSVPVDWRLQLDGPWAHDTSRRRRVRLPDSARSCPPWAAMLDMVTHLTPHLPPAPLVADAQCAGEPEQLMAGLAGQELDFLIEVPPSTKVLAQGLFRPDTSPRPTPVASLAHHSLAHLRTARPTAAAEPRLWACRTLVTVDGVAKPLRLWAQQHPGQSESSPLWLTNLTHAREDIIGQLIAYATSGRRTVTALAQGYGLADFEGRSYPGWHHHMTMVSAAYGYRALQEDPAAGRSVVPPARPAGDGTPRAARPPRPVPRNVPAAAAQRTRLPGAHHRAPRPGPAFGTGHEGREQGGTPHR